MDIDAVPTLIDQYRETFEGEVTPGMCWITDGRPDTAIFGTIAPLTYEQAFARPAPGGKTVAAHVEHLRFTLDLTVRRLNGENPPADWKSSFITPPPSAEAWAHLQSELRRAYGEVLSILQRSRNLAPDDWPPIQLVGLSALTAHNAYHLGAIRQIANVVRTARA